MPRKTRWSGLQGPKEKAAILREVGRWVTRHGGDALSFGRLRAELDLNQARVFRHWRGIADLRAELGLPRHRQRRNHVSDEELFADLHAVVDRLGRFPTRPELDRAGTYSSRTYYNRFGGVDAVRAAYKAWLAAGGLEVPDDLDDPSGPRLDDVLAAWKGFRVGFVVRTSQYRDGKMSHTFTHDFVVCVDHDWPGCPLPVVRLGDLGWRFDRTGRGPEGSA
ncbi:MAG: hypothetical protein AAGJ97_14150 [Planctomycetota bacterium]